jgi:hypothetical protein
MRFTPLALLLIATPLPAADDLFESKVRPLLVEQCHRCHADKKQKGSIRVDGLAHLLRPGDGGAALVVPGKPDDSRLVKVLRHADGVAAMPEGGEKLPDDSVKAVADWIAAGAKWPDTPTAAPKSDHWAFKPVNAPPVPEVKQTDWPASDIDRFILATLESKKLIPSAPAEPRTLLRRVYFDLTGLPPTAAQVEAFAKDPSAEAFAKIVDELLASPKFGERWGRHWLDVARYSDTNGAAVAGEDTRYPFAYTYRDWVVKALNADTPYDQFVRQQLAADLLAPGETNPDLPALGFLTLGRKFQDNEPDVIDDRLDAIFRGTQALTVGCARCHDHKYDPVPIHDYYSLYAVFAGAKEEHVPVVGGPAERAKYLAYSAEVRSRVRSFKRFEEAERKRIVGPANQEAGRYLMALKAGGEVKVDEARKRADGLDEQVMNKYRDLLGGLDSYHHPVLAPWHEFAKLDEKQFEVGAKELAAKFAANDDDEKPLNPLVAKLFAGKPPQSLEQVGDRYGKLFAGVCRKWQRKVAEADRTDAARPTEFEDEAEDEIRQLFYAEFPALDLTEEEVMNRLGEEPRRQFDRLKAAIGEWANGPDAFPHARILVDAAEPGEQAVFVRGHPDTPGDTVPRRFLKVLSGEERAEFGVGTARLELAKAITDPANPLTARVWVNRVWGHLLGAPIVATASDFGLRSAAPTHPELLDHLADSLVQNGWSTKQLIRGIVLSSTYQQASGDRPDARGIDPANTLLWRANRKRLAWEPLRDAMLAAGGTLDDTVGGRPADNPDESNRRTLYLPFRTFDFANPDLSSPGRHETTVPQQALFLLNSRFVADQARKLAAKAGDANLADAEWVTAAYRAALGRDPTADEAKLATEYLTAAGKLKDVGLPPKTKDDRPDPLPPPSPREKFAQVLLLTAEFGFVD